MACEKDADAAGTIFGQGHERLMRKTATGKVYFQPDLYGSILSVSDGQGQNLGYSEWDVWGNVKFHGQGNQPLPEGGAVPGFTSYIPDSVTGKHFAQARFYDPAHGRMLSPDPVKRGLNGKWGKANWLEPVTTDFPGYGSGGAKQVITNQKIVLNKLEDLLK